MWSIKNFIEKFKSILLEILLQLPDELPNKINVYSYYYNLNFYLVIGFIPINKFWNSFI